MRETVEIDEFGKLYYNDAPFGKDPRGIRDLAQDIFDKGLTHMHVVKHPNIPIKKLLIFTKP